MSTVFISNIKKENGKIGFQYHRAYRVNIMLHLEMNLSNYNNISSMIILMFVEDWCPDIRIIQSNSSDFFIY